MRSTPFLLVLLALAAACSNKLGGEVTINGEIETATSCRNGAVYGFRGVELTLASGARLRIAATQTGEGSLVVSAAGRPTGVIVGPCGPFVIENQNSTINRVTNVEGSAELDCEREGFKVKGKLTFSNCH